MKQYLLIMFLPSLLFSQIITKSGTYNLNDYINLQTGASANLQKGTYDRNQYPCTTRVDNRDLFMNGINITLCVCACPYGAIGSPRPFYKSKKSFSTMNLSYPLNLKDTTFFTKIDTVTNYTYFSGCFLPFYVLDIHGNSSGVFVITTSSDKYALVRLNPNIISHLCYDLETQSSWSQDLLTGYNVTWYLQSNGAPYFYGVDQSNIQKGKMKRVEICEKQKSAKIEYFTLRGQKTRALSEYEKKGQLFIKSIYIAKTSEKFFLILR
jgi:hypothetical protein